MGSGKVSRRRDVDNRHDNPLPEMMAARARAPRAWALLDEIDRVLWGDIAQTGISIREIEALEHLIPSLRLCGHGRYGDISEKQAAEIRGQLDRARGRA